MGKILFKMNKRFDLSKINLITSLFVSTVVFLCIFLSAIIPILKFETAIEVTLVLITGYFVFDAVNRHAERHELIETTNDNFRNLIEHIGVMSIIKSPEEYYNSITFSRWH
jgi:hypothetical protein